VTSAADRTATAAPSMRDRIVEAAVSLTTEVGWARVTMAAIADRVGVSRQTVYNEAGTKPGLAEAMILHELDRFLGVVNLAFDAHPGDLVGAIRAASRDVLVLAEGNPLLPLLTTHAESLLAAAKFVVAGRVEAYDVGLDEEHLAAAIDMVVRVVLSHVMQPSDSPDRTADDLAWIAARVLGGRG
jgi:AcrR family transcriptional regulator